MDWLKGMNSVVEHIEANLTEQIQYDELARMVGCSAYEFSRIFSFMTGVPISEYIRRRRLSSAVFDIQKGGEKVVDVALKYCYESPSTFARAFKELHGVTPIEARKSGTPLVMYPKMSFALTIMGQNELRFRIEKRGEFTLMGIEQNIQVDDDWSTYEPMLHRGKHHLQKTINFRQFAESELDAPLEVVSKLPNGFYGEGVLEGDFMLVDEKEGVYENKDGQRFLVDYRGESNQSLLFGLHFFEGELPEGELNAISAIDFQLQNGKIRRYFGFDAAEKKLEFGKRVYEVNSCKTNIIDRNVSSSVFIGECTIPAATWAVFTVASDIDKDSMSKAYMRILTEWFPGSKYERDESKPHLEKHAMLNKGQTEWEIWMPVVEK